MRCGKFYFEDKFNKIKPAYFTESDKHSNYAHHKEKKTVMLYIPEGGILFKITALKCWPLRYYVFGI